MAVSQLKNTVPLGNANLLSQFYPETANHVVNDDQLAQSVTWPCQNSVSGVRDRPKAAILAEIGTISSERRH